MTVTCQQSAACKGTATEYICQCPPGYGGKLCEKVRIIDTYDTSALFCCWLSKKKMQPTACLDIVFVNYIIIILLSESG